jgi:hypothetical protein
MDNNNEDRKAASQNLLATFESNLDQIGFQFRDNLLSNDLTSGEVRDRLVEHLQVDLDRVCAGFLREARDAGLCSEGGGRVEGLERVRFFHLTEPVVAATTAAGGAAAGTAALSVVVKTIATGMLWWKGAEVVTVATVLAGAGLNPLVLPAAAAVAAGAVGWKLSGGMVHRSRQRRLRKEFDGIFQKTRARLLAWAAKTNGPETSE